MPARATYAARHVRAREKRSERLRAARSRVAPAPYARAIAGHVGACRPRTVGQARRSGCDGFTLVELMVTIAVAAILLALAAPAFTRLIANTRESAAANSLVHAFEYARNTALRTGEPVTVCPTAAPSDATCSASTGWDSGWGVISAPAGAASVLLAAGSPGARGVTVSASGGVVPMVFTPRGLVTGLATGANLFTICDGRGSTFAHAVVVNTGGYVQASQTPGRDPGGGALTCAD